MLVVVRIGSESATFDQLFISPPSLFLVSLEGRLWEAWKSICHPNYCQTNFWTELQKDVVQSYVYVLHSLTDPLNLFITFKFLSLILPTLSSVSFWHLRSSDHHPSDNHSSSQALYLQCHPHHCSPFGLHFSPSWFHQQTPWSSANHSHSTCHPSATLPSSQPGASFLWDQARPRCPMAHHTEGWNCGTSMSQRISRWGQKVVYAIFFVCFVFLGDQSLFVFICPCISPTSRHCPRGLRLKPVLNKWKAHLPQETELIESNE